MYSVAKMICPMKQFFSYLGASLAAIAALASCNKEIDAPVEDLKGGVPFEICASADDTKTTIDGRATSWVANDAINLFHAEASTTAYTSDGQFTITSENLATNKFTGTLAAELVAGSYDWYAIYPYKKEISSPADQTDGYVYIGHSKGAIQDGYNSTAHLCKTLCPLYGVSKSVEATTPVSLEMKHLTSVVEINVTNSNDDPLTVSSISFSTGEDIVGSYYINFAGETVVYNPSDANYVKTVANLTVQNGTALAKGETASFYIPIKPHVAEQGSVITITVNGYEKTIPLTKDVTFTAGKIKKINFNYDNTTVNSVTFDFSNPESLGLTKPSSSANITAAIVVGDVTLTTTNGGTATRIWNSAGTCDLRVYSNGGSLTFTVPEGSVITQIVFTGAAASSGYSASAGTLRSGTWTGSNQSVKFTASSNLKISTAVVTYSAGKANTSIIADDITGISARGVSDGQSSYTIENPVDGTTISATCDGTVVTAVDAEDGLLVYAVSANKTTASREGSITLTYGDVTKVVKVSQLAPVFKVSRSEVELEATANSSSTITVTSDFDWMSDSSAGAGFTSSPTTCEWNAGNPFTDGKTIVTITASAENASEEGTKTLGTLTFTNLSTEETLVVTVTQKTSYVAPSTGTEVTFTMTTSGDFSNGTTATKDVITIAGGQGSYTSNINVGSSYTKVYAGNTLTISGTAGTKIKKVVFSATTGYIKTWSADDNSECVVSSTDNTMTWNNASGVESVVFTNTATAQARVKTIVVTYE